jgi:ABC-type multidrug transport system permease subunit
MTTTTRSWRSWGMAEALIVIGAFAALFLFIVTGLIR